jgi:hypothetical protein
MKHGLCYIVCLNMIPKAYIDEYFLWRDVRGVFCIRDKRRPEVVTGLYLSFECEREATNLRKCTI